MTYEDFTAKGRPASKEDGRIKAEDGGVGIREKHLNPSLRGAWSEMTVETSQRQAHSRFLHLVQLWACFLMWKIAPAMENFPFSSILEALHHAAKERGTML
ncbi:hypothetical protein GJAV_G00111450 [Gymnothorax javanicus]|nr:hypothetical protein GJAV_G00111450 [Gymnothorax javanicus]